MSQQQRIGSGVTAIVVILVILLLSWCNRERPRPPSITRQPTALTVNVGSQATFSVAATGAEPLFYQWQVSTDGATWFDVPANIGTGGMTQSYTSPSTDASMNGWGYRVKISNKAGAVNSDMASLTVAPSPASSVASNGQPVANSGKSPASVPQPATQPPTKTLKPLPSTQTKASPQQGSERGASNKRFTPVAKAGGGQYALTECVKDSLTGLEWEGKTASGPRAGSNTYTNYDSSAPGNGQKLINTTTADATAEDVAAPTNSIGYVKAVNGMALCGQSDWRLPTVAELRTLVDYAVPVPGPTINKARFPNTGAALNWSATPAADNRGHAWNVSFFNGYINFSNRSNRNYVRLIRGGK